MLGSVLIACSGKAELSSDGQVTGAGNLPVDQLTEGMCLAEFPAERPSEVNVTPCPSDDEERIAVIETFEYEDGDGDGIPNGVEGAYDTDNDGIPNSADGDSDGDGASDKEEGTSDGDGDGIPNYVSLAIGRLVCIAQQLIGHG